MPEPDGGARGGVAAPGVVRVPAAARGDGPGAAGGPEPVLGRGRPQACKGLRRRQRRHPQHPQRIPQLRPHPEQHPPGVPRHRGRRRRLVRRGVHGHRGLAGRSAEVDPGAHHEPGVRGGRGDSAGPAGGGQGAGYCVVLRGEHRGGLGAGVPLRQAGPMLPRRSLLHRHPAGVRHAGFWVPDLEALVLQGGLAGNGLVGGADGDHL
mmetsp:Transcript_90306/g.241907  ORF Transcript_90306/g.241907 Transcript_90306/m.241907 type:complete len:207 (+) Transcript_90306:423-1043(+)